VLAKAAGQAHIDQPQPGQIPTEVSVIGLRYSSASDCLLISATPFQGLGKISRQSAVQLKMNYLLKDIATIRSGYLFRERIESDPQGEYQVIQIGDLSDDTRLSDGSLTRISLPEIKPSHIVKKGEVLFISRGQSKRAVAVTKNLDKAIATSQLFVLHPNEILMGEYLAWYINQRPAQTYLEEQSTGTNVSLINMEAMSKMPLQVPSLGTQRWVVEIDRLSRRENELIASIQNRRREIIELSLLNMVERETGSPPHEPAG
jgi:Type I restriction modification DNA specificity domain